MTSSPREDVADSAARSSRTPLIWFVALAYLFSWAWWLPLLVNESRVHPGDGWPSHLPGLMGPAVAAVIVTAWQDGQPGLSELWSRIIRWRVGWIWYGVIALTAALALIPILTGASDRAGDILKYSGAPSVGALTIVLVVITCFGEEIGWRGFLAHRLLDDNSRGRTALVVWPIWATWHLPMFWVVANFRDFGLIGTVGWVLGIGFGSLFLTWLYQSAKYSILIVALWHAAYNFATATEASSDTSAVLATIGVIIAAVAILRRPSTWTTRRAT